MLAIPASILCWTANAIKLRNGIKRPRRVLRGFYSLFLFHIILICIILIRACQLRNQDFHLHLTNLINTFLRGPDWQQAFSEIFLVSGDQAVQSVIFGSCDLYAIFKILPFLLKSILNIICRYRQHRYQFKNIL